MSQTSALIIRYALCALFLWFGVQQLINPGAWLAFLPEWTGYLPIPGEMFVQINGWIEVVLGTLLALGVLTRVMFALLGAHLFFIALTVGGATGMRDGVLAVTALAMVFSKPDNWTLDHHHHHPSSVSPAVTEEKESDRE